MRLKDGMKLRVKTKGHLCLELGQIVTVEKRLSITNSTYFRVTCKKGEHRLLSDWEEEFEVVA